MVLSTSTKENPCTPPDFCPSLTSIPHHLQLTAHQGRLRALLPMTRNLYGGKIEKPHVNLPGRHLFSGLTEPGNNTRNSFHAESGSDGGSWTGRAGCASFPAHVTSAGASGSPALPPSFPVFPGAGRLPETQGRETGLRSLTLSCCRN